MADRFPITVGPNEAVTALIYRSRSDQTVGLTVLLGHGAGAGQTSGFMVAFAQGLAGRGIDAVTFNFLYTEHGRRTPDRTDKLKACWQAAIAGVRAHPGLRENNLVIGGKSMGGRIASMVAAEGVHPVDGLLFLGYPLHPPGRPDQPRTAHLGRITVPMLFVQGSRDSFGTPAEVRTVIEQLNLPASLIEIKGGDHSFGVPKSLKLSRVQVYESALDQITRWLAATVMSGQ
jgi:hypothetical protein